MGKFRAVIFIPPLLFLLALSGCIVSLGDNVQFEQLHTELQTEAIRAVEGDFLPLQEELVSEVSLFSSNGTLSYSENRRSLSRANALNNHYRLIWPLYSCFDISFGSAERNAFICPDDFRSFNDLEERIYALALSRDSLDFRESGGYAIYFPFPLLTVNGRPVALTDFAASREPSYEEMLKLAQRPMSLAAINSTKDSVTLSAAFSPEGTDVCVDFGFSPKRANKITVSSDLPFLNYTFYGRSPEANMRVETGARSITFTYDALDDEYTNLTLAKVCFR